MLRNVHAARLALAAIALAATGTALAAPTEVTITPPRHARFLSGQRFDLRVEGKGTGPFSATLKVNGRAVAFTSGAQGTTTTDGITSAGYGGFNVRGYSLGAPGRYDLEASFTDATGTTTATSTIEIVGVGGKSGDDSGRVKNVILFIGDGMGVAHRTAARLVRHGVAAGDPNGWLAMDRMPGTGLLTTHSLNSIITDSAPGMSCYTTGNHQNNNQEGVFPAKVTNPFFGPRVEYLGHYLHRVKGTSLGIVSTADIEDATPAANAVFTANRGAGTGICDQYLDESDPADTRTGGTGLRVLMGGGRRWFLPSTDPLSSRGTSTDYSALPEDLVAAWDVDAAGSIDPARDLLAGFSAAGFSYAESKTALDSLLAGGAPDKLLGLFGYGNMNTALDKLAARRGISSAVVDDHRAPDQPMLDEMTRAAIDVLKKDRDGFVLMVEGAHVDKQSHAMDADRVIGETIELDRAIEAGLEFAMKDGKTLVLVTADHECAGFSLIGALTGGVSNLRSLPSDASVVDPATQPGRQKVVGVYETAGFPRYSIAPDGYPASYDVDGKVLVGFGGNADRYEDWLTNQKPIIESLTPAAISIDLAARGYARNPVDQADEKASGFFVRGQATGRSSAVHTAADVPISAYARDPNVWQRFVGVRRNTDVFFEIAGAVLGD